MRGSVKAGMAAVMGLMAVDLWGAAKVELTVQEPAGVARANEWVTTGVPLAQGVVKDIRALRLVSGGRSLPAQFTLQCPWPDGSVKWVLCTFPVTVAAKGEAKITLTDSGAAAPAGRLTVKDGADAVVVDTGAIVARIGKKAFRILDEVTRGGKMLLKQGDADGAVLSVTADQKINAADLVPEEVKMEESGPRRACVMARGRFKDAMIKDGKAMIRWTCRVYFYEGSDVVRIHFTLGNDGAMGANLKQGREYFKFKSLRLDFGLALGGGVKAAAAEAEGAPAAGAAFAIRQKGAYKAPGIFEARLGDKVLAESDARSPGALAVTGPAGGMRVAVREFWQNYPKELAVAPDRLSVVLWPDWAGYPEGQSVYNLCGGRQKTHEIVLSFAGGGQDAAVTLAHAVNRPLMALAAPEYYADCGALGLWSPAGVVTGDAELDGMIKRYDDLQRSKPAGLTQAADAKHKGAYYNWVNWGDLNWAAGSCSLHYDWTHIMLVHWLRTGQRNFFDWGYSMARHQHDIDMPRSSRDMLPYRYLSAYEKETSDGGTTGWHLSKDKGSMLPITSHHWVQGQGLYAVLTGDPEAFVTLKLNGAEGIRNRLRKALAGKREDQARCYGWAIECLLAVHNFTGDTSVVDDAKKLFENGLWYMFTEKYNKSGDMGGNVQTSYIGRPLIDYHWHTGDARALEMLKAIVDKSGDWKDKYEYMMYVDPSAYVYYRIGDEAYLKKARDYLAVLLKRRGKFSVKSGAWTKEEAKTSRSGYIHIGIERLKKLGKAPVK